MYLLNTKTAELHYFVNSHEVRYAILSHVWQSGDELSFVGLQALSAECALSGESLRDRVPAKIRDCCIFAERAGYDWIWVDTCCIDHHSSAELSEAINSMFAWYADADVCYAYLYDVGDDDDPASLDSAFRRSRWYERGWTLQELIAPARIVFLSQKWRTLGSKHMLAAVVEAVTGVQKEILTHARSLDSVSVAQRMSWAANRKTTRIEDRAYSLLGIFGINMPTIYGEGERAFVRLQEEILRRIPDQSIFAWGPMHKDIKLARQLMERDRFEDSERATHGRQANIAFDVQGRLQDLLASSPSEFADSAGYKAVNIADLAATFGIEAKMPHYAVTSNGIRAILPLSTDAIESWKSWMARTGAANTQHVQLGLLACENADGELIILLLRRGKQAAGDRYDVGEFIDGTEGHHYHRGAFFPRTLLHAVETVPATMANARGIYDQVDEEVDEGEGSASPPPKGSTKEKKPRVIKFRYGKFELKPLYIHHPNSLLPPQTHPDGPVRDVMAPQPNFTFFFPHWLLTDLETRHHLLCEQASTDGCTTTVPCHLTQQQVSDSVVSTISFFDASLHQRLTVRFGVGNCMCLMVPFPGPQGIPLHKLWVDVLLTREQSRANAPAFDGKALPKLSEPAQMLMVCPRAHIDFTSVRGDNAVIRAAFGDRTRRVEVAFRKREGFEIIRKIPCKTYTVTLALSGPVYDTAVPWPIVPVPSEDVCADATDDRATEPLRDKGRSVHFRLPERMGSRGSAVHMRRQGPGGHPPPSALPLHTRLSLDRTRSYLLPFASFFSSPALSSMPFSTGFT
ncbi:HET-domain-containing protein [Trametes versicolor FP-101664 SS1]|uniref:HET-domain-containing protein n=1 Tax=Trametes versicolor (strain FP-101664) TaxID=717944 RepID=UPI0004623E1E|nr:HET-domain-containing protein [Trametes versicolor FP-101664 SS1]EIW54582.1 HET-domain-containing protein [Trametes versicolor FP-101664 SS1]